MADFDDLDSFFNEIKSVAPDSEVEFVSTAQPQIPEAPPPSQVVFSKPRVIARQAEISKPPEIVSHASHPVYTYDASAYETEADGSFQQGLDDSSYISKSNLSDYTHQRGHSVPVVPRQNKKFVRTGAGDVWIDNTLNEWPENDYRIFVGDLAKEVTSEMLGKHFQIYKSYAKAKVLRTKHENKARGFGFVSFLDPMDCAKAIREQNGKYLASRPMKITKSSWKDRDIKEVKKKETKKRKLQESLGLA